MKFKNNNCNTKQNQNLKFNNKIFNHWLQSSKLNIFEIRKMLKFNQAQIDAYFNNEPLKFGTAGVRSTIGLGTNQMNCFTYMQLMTGFVRLLKQKYKKDNDLKIVIGHDNRLHSKKFAQICANIATNLGIKTYLFKNNRLMPTPIISYAIRKLKLHGGVIITASHNPKNYNGFKVYDHEGKQLLPNDTNLITKLMPTNEQVINLSCYKNKWLEYKISNQIIKDYFHDAQSVLVDQSKKTVKEINKQKANKIVLTTHHGTASKLLPQFLKINNFNVKKVWRQSFYSARFLNSKNPNPENFDSFKLAIKKANHLKSDIILAVDPDADRMAVCINHDKNWKALTGNEMGIIYTYYLFQNKTFKKKPFLVHSYVSNNLVDRIVKKYHGIVYLTGTGFKWMADIVSKNYQKKDFILAFEEAIGALNTTINLDKDAFTASLLTLEIYHSLKKQRMDLIDYLEKEIYPKFGYWIGETVSYKITGLNWKNTSNQLMNFFKSKSHSKIANFSINKNTWNKLGDCLEWDLGKDQWIKFRKSGTEPKFKVYYNLYGTNLQSAKSKFAILKNEIDKMIGEKLNHESK